MAHAKGRRTKQSHLMHALGRVWTQEMRTARSKHRLGAAWARHVPALGDDERLDVAGLRRWREQLREEVIEAALGLCGPALCYAGKSQQCKREDRTRYSEQRGGHEAARKALADSRHSEHKRAA